MAWCDLAVESGRKIFCFLGFRCLAESNHEPDKQFNTYN